MGFPDAMIVRSSVGIFAITDGTKKRLYRTEIIMYRMTSIMFYASSET